MALARPRSSWTTRSTKNISAGNFLMGSALMGLLGSKGSTLRAAANDAIRHLPAAIR